MAWADVPKKLENYDKEEYAPDDASSKLLFEFGAVTVERVPELRREEFEEALDYRLGACINLRNSKAASTKQ